MTLVCTKCGSGSRIEHEGKDLHCKNCGNVVTNGIKARWPIVEKKTLEHAGVVTRMPIGQENSQSAKKVNALQNNRSAVSTKLPYGSSLPDVIAQSGSPSPSAQKIKEEEKIMSKAGKCKVEGCEKNVVADGFCYKHYKKEHGEPYKPKTHRGEKKAVEKPVKTTVVVPEIKVKLEAKKPVESDRDFYKMLLAKFPTFNPEWPQEIQTKWFDGFDKLFGMFREAA